MNGEDGPEALGHPRSQVDAYHPIGLTHLDLDYLVACKHRREAIGCQFAPLGAEGINAWVRDWDA